MTGILTRLVTYGLKKSIRSRAQENARGMYGSVGVAICALPLIVSVLFGVFAYFAILDPDPEDKMAGYIVAALSACTLLVFIHFVSYRIFISDHSISSGSLILGERVINLGAPYRLEHDEDAQQLVIKQDRTKIKIGWTLNGYDDLCRRLSEAYQNQTIQGEQVSGGNGGQRR